MDKKYYFYKITNKSNGKYYYGVHSTFNINDGYMGSGVAIKKAILSEGVDNFEKEILKYFPSEREMLAYEAQMVTQELVDDENCYNLTTGGGGADFHPYGLTAVEDKNGKRFLCSTSDPNFLNGEYVSVHKGKLLCENKDGKYAMIPKNSPLMLNGEFVPYQVGKVVAENENGERFYVSTNDNRIKDGELTPTSKNKFTAKDENGKYYYINKNDERYIKGDLFGALKGLTIIKTDNGENKVVSIDEFKTNGYTHVNKGKVPAKDENSNYYLIDKNDERFINKKIIPVSSGMKTITNGKDVKYVPVNVTIDGYHGVNKGKMSVMDASGNTFMCDVNDQRIKNGELVSTSKGRFLGVDKNGNIYSINKNDERYKNGEIIAYSKGRKYDEKHSQKLREARGERVVVNNGINIKFIRPNELSDYINNGWKKGRLSFKHKEKSFYINNGKVVKRVKENLLPNYISEGWIKGGLGKKCKYFSKEELINLLKDKTLDEIGKQFGINRKTVTYWCKKYEI